MIRSTLTGERADFTLVRDSCKRCFQYKEGAMSTYNQGATRQVLLVLVIIAIIIAIIACLISSLLRGESGETLQTVVTEEPQRVFVVPEATPIQFPTTAPIVTPAFVAGTHWYPYQCDNSEIANCLFIQQGQVEGYWALCIDPQKIRPTYYTANQIAFDWYILGTYGILYPVDPNRNLQSFRFTVQ
jgi:hypothetical protein